MLTAKGTITFTVVTLVIALGHNSVIAAPAKQREIESQPAVRAMNTIKVRVLIYSGRPDPEFVIPVSQIQAYMKKATRLKSQGDSVIPARLGYKGILVENSAKAGGLPEYLAIYNGKIEAGNKEKTYFIDENRNLENFLLKEAVKRKAIGEDLFNRIKIEDRKENKKGNGETGKE